MPLYVASHTYDWDVKIDTFGTGFQYFYYTMTRGLRPSNDIVELLRRNEERKTVCHEVTPTSDSEDEDFLLGVDVS